MSFKTPMRSVPFISALATAQGSTAKPSTICKRRFIVSSRTDVTTPADAILAFFALLVRGQPTAIFCATGGALHMGKSEVSGIIEQLEREGNLRLSYNFTRHQGHATRPTMHLIRRINTQSAMV